MKLPFASRRRKNSLERRCHTIQRLHAALQMSHASAADSNVFLTLCAEVRTAIHEGRPDPQLSHFAGTMLSDAEHLAELVEDTGRDASLVYELLFNLSQLAFAEGDERISQYSYRLGLANKHAERWAAAETAFAFSYRHLRAVHTANPNHPHLAHAAYNLGDAVAAQGRNEEAEVFFREALVIREALHGRCHPWVSQCLYRIGTSIYRQGRASEASTYMLRAAAVGGTQMEKTDAAWAAIAQIVQRTGS